MKKKVVRFILSISFTLVLTLNLLTGMSAAASSFITYKVVSGDSLWKISTKYNVSVQDITRTNNIKGTNITPGQQLKIPIASVESNTIYTVKKGDVLWQIAYNFGITTQELIDANNLDTSKYLYIGQQLYIPNAASSNIVYTVVNGDTMWKISAKYGVSTGEILKFNALTSSSIINVGQKIIIPSNGKINPPSPSNNDKPYITHKEYIVKSGDNPWNLSLTYGIPMNEILEANKLTSQSYLSIGQKILIPIHNVPVTSTPGAQYGEYLDWWTQAQYVFPIGAKAKVIDFATGKSFNIVRSYGAFHADCEPLTSKDAAVMYELGGNNWNWITRSCIVEINGRRIAASFTNIPHDVQEIKNNNFNGHFDIHFLNSTRHVDNLINQDHQKQIKISAGLK